MSLEKRIVVDANILLRWVLGERVPRLLFKHRESIEFLTPEGCFAEAERNIVGIFARKSISSTGPVRTLKDAQQLVGQIVADDYSLHEEDARARMRSRDETDWPIVASALLLDCPIWTEDRDFFGCGVATWMTETVEIYLGS
jgi:predicted nucleic acid-binding protein